MFSQVASFKKRHWIFNWAFPQSCETPTTFQSARVSENRQGLKGYKPTNANLGEQQDQQVGPSGMESLACNIWGKEMRKVKKNMLHEPHPVILFQFGDATNIYK